ncbi:cocaine- and amphetamine-regulated transcript protein-like [Ambystoma mexicanum]|uniref:cocaine- and amphetamine-regulated transcript protein-like n=1 Tax=Ambystoma mexicanum TaxID=8296 RepID=UPI0037E884F8
MDSAPLLVKLLCGALLLTLCLGQSSRDFYPDELPEKRGPSSEERDLAEAMEHILLNFESKHPSHQKKAAQIPICDGGGKCAMKYGARIGLLCQCPQGTCSTLLLKCI